jgi:hypothetical protein
MISFPNNPEKIKIPSAKQEQVIIPTIDSLQKEKASMV